MSNSSRKLTVSLIITTYNRAHMISDTLDSVLNQTRIPDEIIVVDDGSTDDTQAVLAGYGMAITVVCQENQGAAAARNAGIRASTGDLIAFLDSDDRLALDSIEKRAAALERRADYGVAYSDVWMTDLDGKSYGPWPGPRPSGDVFLAAARYNLLTPIAYMFRREILGLTGFFDESLIVNEDFDFLLRAAAKSRFYYIDEPLAFYRFHSAMTVKTKRLTMVREAVEVMQGVYSMPEFKALSAKQKSVVFSSHGIKLMQDFPQIAQQCFGRAIRCYPLGLRSYALLALSLFGRRVFGAFHSLYLKSRGYVSPPV